MDGMRKPYLERLELKGFKAFNEVSIDFAPVTVLIGENSAGKTSLLQALLLLKETLEASPSLGELALGRGKYMTFPDTFRELVYGMPEQDAQIGWTLYINPRVQQVSIKPFDDDEMLDKVGFMIGERHGKVQLLSFTGGFRGSDKIYPVAHTNWFLPRTFTGEPYDIFRELFDGMNYIGPIRGFAGVRYFPISGVRPHWVGAGGENVATFLESHPEVKELVRNWFVEKAGLAREVDFHVLPDIGKMEIVFTDKETGLKVDISRMGFGFSQILPLAVAVHSEMNFLIFEGPEVHLNSSLHGVVTDLFVDAANRGKQVLVETHSEHIIYRLQRRVADGTISPEDVAIYYIYRSEQGSQARRLPLTSTGEIADWPTGFFESEVEDIFERILIQAGNRK